MTEDDLQTISQDLHRRYSPDAAQEALVALITRSRPDALRSPLAFCRRVAKRQSISRGAQRNIVPSTPDSWLFGTQQAEQLDRLVLREELQALSSVDLLRGLGYLDPEPLDPKPDGGRTTSRLKRNWELSRRRRRAALTRAT